MKKRIVLFLVASLAVECDRGATPDSALKKPKGANKLQYPVEVALLTPRPVRYTVMAPGGLEAFQQVQITARVSGAVDRVAFVEGQSVTAGQVLVVVESDRYQVAVDQARAALAKVQAGEKAAEAQLARRQGAVTEHPGLVPGEEIEQYATAVATAKADVDSAIQNLRVAQLNLRDAYIHAPFAGVIQTRSVQLGQYLQPGAVLATLLQRDPLLVRFPVSEQDAPRIKPGMIAQVALRESTRAYDAKIMLVADAADPATRLVQVTGQIDDKEHRYWLRPGAFCDVSVPVGDARVSIVVPSMSVQPTESGNIVYVVDTKNVAHKVSVSLGMHTPEGGVEVTQGLQGGQLLVVRGFEPLSEGAPVQVTERTTVEALESQGGPDAGTASVPSTAPSWATDAGPARPLPSSRSPQGSP
jgi:RND family efflux transporter MFP subunit